MIAVTNAAPNTLVPFLVGLAIGCVLVGAAIVEMALIIRRRTAQLEQLQGRAAAGDLFIAERITDPSLKCACLSGRSATITINGGAAVCMYCARLDLMRWVFSEESDIMPIEQLEKGATQL